MIKNNIFYDKVNTIGTIVHIAINSEYKGNIIISDEIKDATYDGTFNAINSAFLKSTIYTTKRLDETKFRIEKINNDIVNSY